MPSGRLAATLRALREGGVEFILVGGMSAVLNGADVHTYDVDIVHSRDPENIARILPVLESLDAVFRIQRERRLKPTATHLTGTGHLNLITRYGPLDLLGTIGRDLGYEELLPHSSEMDIGGGVRIRVLNLEKLIEIKEELAGEKDRAMLPILRRTLEEKKKIREPIE
jgi:predicted nucleotidyltransferase